MSEVIVITSGKGGVGKTTTSANVGTGLAKLDKKVVLIDTDIGLRNLDVVMGLENRIVYNLVDVVEGNCRPKQAMIKDKRYNNLYLLPSAQTRDKTSVTPEQMVALVDELREEFDYIILDCPAGIEQGFKMKKSDLIINRIRMDMVKKGDMMSIEDVVDILAINLIGAVPDDENIVISTNQGEPLAGNDTLPGQAYMNICKRIMGEDVPMLDLAKNNGFFAKIAGLFKKN